jgi:hypothetical protein
MKERKQEFGLVRLVVTNMCVNDDVEDACMDESLEGHDDVNTCVRMYNINITTWYLSFQAAVSSTGDSWAAGTGLSASDWIATE